MEFAEKTFVVFPTCLQIDIVASIKRVPRKLIVILLSRAQEVVSSLVNIRSVPLAEAVSAVPTKTATRESRTKRLSVL